MPNGVPRWLRWALPLTVGAWAVFYLLKTFDAETLGIAIAGLDWTLLFVTGPLLILTYFAIRTVRWCWLLVGHDQKGTGLFRLYLAVGMSLGLSSITPVQSGEALKLWLSKREMGVGLIEAAALHLLERVVDVVVLAALTSLALILSSSSAATIMGSLGMTGVLAILAAALMKKRLSLVLPGPIGIGLSAIASAVAEPRRFLGLIMLTLIGWCVIGLLWAAAFSAAGVTDLALAELVSIVGLVTFATLLSLLPGGLGVSEASTIALLLLTGALPEVALAGAVSLRVVGAMTAGMGALFWAIRTASRSRD